MENLSPCFALREQDVGSGLGHLSRMLAYKYGLNVVAVEMAGQRLPVAEKFDKYVYLKYESFTSFFFISSLLYVPYTSFHPIV